MGSYSSFSLDLFFSQCGQTYYLGCFCKVYKIIYYPKLTFLMPQCKCCRFSIHFVRLFVWFTRFWTLRPIICDSVLPKFNLKATFIGGKKNNSYYNFNSRNKYTVWQIFVILICGERGLCNVENSMIGDSSTF